MGLYHRRREGRTTVRRGIHFVSPDHSSTSTVLGLLNARSLSSKSSAIYDLIVADRLHICTVVETWHDSVDSPQLIACTPPGYRYIERARPRSTSAALTTNCNHGGLCLFYASFLSAREVQLPTYTSGIEVLAVYLRGAGRNMLAIVLYRPGSAATTNAFFDDFADVLERASSFACPFVLLGDVNIHLDVPTHPDTIKWQSILDSHDLVQHVTSATHCAGHTLDVVVTLSDCPVHNVCVQPPSLSDHSVITASVELHLGRGQLAGSVHRRQWRQFDCDAFCDDLRQSDLLLEPPADVVNLVACYNDTLRALLDKHAPFTTIKPRAHINAPWYDRQCQQAKAVTRRLERAYRRDKSIANYEAWRRQSTLLRSTLRRTYVDYWSTTIAANLHDSKALWSKLNVLLKTQSPTSDVHTAEHFADFFRNKVANIRRSTANASPPVIADRQCASLSAFVKVSAEEVSKIVMTAPAKHCSLDPVPTWLLKRLQPLLGETLAMICNASFKEGVFPESLKQAIVRPRLKKSTLNADDLGCYRPISNLSFLSKVIERAAAARLSAHIESQRLLPCRQSAYRDGHSTETAIIAVHDELVRSIDSGDVCALVLLDLSAAFDTVDHQTLLRVLSCRFGVRDTALDWCKSYLSERSQTVYVNAQQSESYTVDCSVPQGSVLGPQKFIIYTEDLADLINNHQLSYHLYADDAQLIAPTALTNAPAVVERLQQCIVEIHQWCASRRLQLNPSKTELIWFGSHTNLQKMRVLDLSLKVGSDVIQCVDAVRDLGVTLDSELTMKQHVNKVARACFYHIRRLKQIRRLLGPRVAASLVSAFVLSRLDYCNAILAGLPKSTIAPLQRVQNAAARLVARLGPHDHVSSAIRDLHWLPVQQRITYKLCLLMHLVHTGRAPSYLVDSVTATRDVGSRSRLRSANSHRYELPRTRRIFGEHGFSYAGPSAWNTLPSSLHELSNTSSFKRRLKTVLFTRAYGP